MKEYAANTNMGDQGFCVLEYAPPNFGKTHGALTLPGRTRFINFESKDPRNVIGGSPNIIIYDDFLGFDEIIATLNRWVQEAREGKADYQNLFLDGTSFQMGKFKMDFEDSHYEKKLERSKKKPEEKPYLFDRFSMGDDTLQGWGGLASAMKRVTDLANKFTKQNINVIMTAWEMESPKYQGIGGEYIDYGPSYQGKEFGGLLAGYFDLIGRIVVPPKFNGDDVERPVISFVQNGKYGKYLCRATGKLTPHGAEVPLDWEQIFGFLRQK